MASQPLLVCVLLVSPLAIFVFPQDGVRCGTIHITKFAWKAGVQVVTAACLYKLSNAKPTRKPRGVYFSSTATMRAQIFREYGASAVELQTEHPRPKIVNPDDILVSVRAASVNSIDHLLISGFARSEFDRQRARRQLPYGGAELPFVLGRDCSGVVVAVGSSVTKFQVSDEVYLALGAADTPGTFAELVLAKEYMVARKPRTLNHSSAASLPYVATTTWSALVEKCGLGPESTAGKRVLILAGTGGVGSFAIQLVKTWGGHVTTTCATDGVPMAMSLGADDVIDYVTDNLEEALSLRERFDVVFVTLGPAFYQLSRSVLVEGGRAVTIVVPFVANFDKYGKILGTLKNISLIFAWKLQNFLTGRNFMISFNQPNGSALEQVSTLVDEGKIKPVVQREFNFESTNEALEFTRRGHARGKTVVVMPHAVTSS
ncbi:reticulon-4-interacting protein 1 homolog, mitochondrial-like [Diadema antillarum]|uniref:reticulon-4-interacting protein 1 homolog, mitochondrial-like n=1 Tax=Diadema antillarum TaxID=105358 RepID=UPI003A8ACA37